MADDNSGLITAEKVLKKRVLRNTHMKKDNVREMLFNQRWQKIKLKIVYHPEFAVGMAGIRGFISKVPSSYQ